MDKLKVNIDELVSVLEKSTANTDSLKIFEEKISNEKNKYFILSSLLKNFDNNFFVNIINLCIPFSIYFYILSNINSLHDKTFSIVAMVFSFIFVLFLCIHKKFSFNSDQVSLLMQVNSLNISNIETNNFYILKDEKNFKKISFFEKLLSKIPSYSLYKKINLLNSYFYHNHLFPNIEKLTFIQCTDYIFQNRNSGIFSKNKNFYSKFNFFKITQYFIILLNITSILTISNINPFFSFNQIFIAFALIMYILQEFSYKFFKHDDEYYIFQYVENSLQKELTKENMLKLFKTGFFNIDLDRPIISVNEVISKIKSMNEQEYLTFKHLMSKS